MTRSRAARGLFARARRDDEGSAMIVVLSLGLTLTIIAYGLLDSAAGGTRLSKNNQNFQASIQAADAGVEDYLYRLNSDPSYATFTNTAKDCFGATAAAKPDTTNQAMNGTYTTIPGGASNGAFTYTVDNSKFCTSGVITVSSTGRVQQRVNGRVVDQERTEIATVKRQNFLDFLYFTDKEILDPALYTTNDFAGKTGYASTTTPADVCSRRFYESINGFPAPRPDDVDGKNPGCDNINFANADVINGPLHSNDAILTCGRPTFNGQTTTAWAGANPSAPTTNTHWRTNSGGSCATGAPKFNANSGCIKPGAPANDVCYAAALDLPPSNQQLKAETDARVSSPAGCLFTGPTTIKLTEVSGVGKMDVFSPNTVVANANPGCALDPTTKKATLNIPTNGVVFVENVPGTQTAVSCTAGNGVYFLNATETPTSTTSGTTTNKVNPVGFPIANDISTYGCTDGDAFVQGTLTGRLTIGAEHDVVITEDTKYKNGTSGTDSLGLIANNFVEVYHPVRCSTFSTSGSKTCTAYANLNITGRSTPFNDPLIQAAILSVQHGFRLQNYSLGTTMGTLNVTGAIAQNYRGLVTVIGSTGYVKNYVYDQRLKYSSPPKFIDPVKSSYSVVQYTER